jgi:hypothetical protein
VVLATRPDRRWHAAALTGLAATGDAAARRQLREILLDDRNPLAADASEQAGLCDDTELVRPLSALAQSRNKRISLAALVPLRRFFMDARSSPRGLAAAREDQADEDNGNPRPPLVNAPAAAHAAGSAAVAALVVDAYVDAEVRQEAFAVARLLHGDRYLKLLEDVADQAELEGTGLLAAAETELRRERSLGK